MGCRVVTISGASGLQGLARPEGVGAGRANREAMPDLTAKRTLVKSPPELWSELSEVERLARHLGAFGEIKITKLEPEHTVAWEGEGASGTVSIEPSGWGTKVTLTAQLDGAEVVETPRVEEREPMAEEPEPMAAEPEPMAEEPEPMAEEPEPMIETPVIEEPPAVEPSPPEHVEPIPTQPIATQPIATQPIATQPRRKRGFLAWLFRQRTSTSVAAAPVPAPSDPVAEAPVLEEPPVVEEEPPVVEEEPPLMEEEPAVVEEEPVAEAVAEEPLAEELAQLEQPTLLEGDSDQESRLDPERAQAILDGALDALGSAHHRPFSRG